LKRATAVKENRMGGENARVVEHWCLAQFRLDLVDKRLDCGLSCKPVFRNDEVEIRDIPDVAGLKCSGWGIGPTKRR